MKPSNPDTKAKMLRVRMSEDEFEQLKWLASRQRLSMSILVRRILNIATAKAVAMDQQQADDQETLPKENKTV